MLNVKFQWGNDVRLVSWFFWELVKPGLWTVDAGRWTQVHDFPKLGRRSWFSQNLDLDPGTCKTWTLDAGRWTQVQDFPKHGRRSWFSQNLDLDPWCPKTWTKTHFFLKPGRMVIFQAIKHYNGFRGKLGLNNLWFTLFFVNSLKRLRFFGITIGKKNGLLFENEENLSLTLNSRFTDAYKKWFMNFRIQLYNGIPLQVQVIDLLYYITSNIRNQHRRQINICTVESL